MLYVLEGRFVPSQAYQLLMEIVLLVTFVLKVLGTMLVLLENWVVLEEFVHQDTIVILGQPHPPNAHLEPSTHTLVFQMLANAHYVN